MERIGVNIADNSELEEPYKKFVGQLSDWYGGGELPQLASQDMRYILQLQRQKLNSLGLDMQCELKKTSIDKADVGSLTFSDRIFTNNIVSGNVNMIRSIGSSQSNVYMDTQKIGLTAVIQDLKKDTQPGSNMPMSCPHCGAASTLGELESGCKYCGTKFVMSELYPKVSNFFITRHENRTDRSSKNKSEAVKIMAACFVPLLILSIVIGNGNIVEKIFGAVIMSVIIGGMIFGLKKLIDTFALMGRNARGGSRTISTLARLNKIKQYDPEFSGEYFRDKAISLFRMAAYSTDPTQLACCNCQCPAEAADIIEADIFNLNVNSCEINGDVCDVETTLFLDCLHYTNGRIVYTPDKFRMSMRKRLKKPTELGFSFSAVSCPSCGASFDAHNVKACPFCHTPYELEENDWVITGLWK
ncbi:MAG: hypothetical protein II703_07215 [Ruminococcus sp.]|nr:hypothetical protein [Ruminococcus sp.]